MNPDNDQKNAPFIIGATMKITGIQDERKAARVLLLVAVVVLLISFIIFIYAIALSSSRYPTAADTIKALNNNQTHTK